MANRERGELTLVAGRTRYVLRLTTNSCCELESFADGRTSDDVIDGVNRGSFRDARLLLWMALRDQHPDIATDDPDCLFAIGQIIDQAGGRAAVLERLRELVLLNTETEEVGGAARPRLAHRGRTGVGSTLTH